MTNPQNDSLVILVPEAESMVKAFRERYDPAAQAGMPAHITLLYPFVPNVAESEWRQELESFIRETTTDGKPLM